ncbi:alpha/beta fold hydrolase [Klugiella xanthotipulae]
MPRTADTELPGCYSLIFDNGRGHARIGDILSMTSETVTRRILRLDAGVPEPGMKSRIAGWFYQHPSDLGYEAEGILISTDLGPAPAWLIHGSTVGRWAIHVHGRGVQRAEAIRAIPPFAAEGFTNLLVSYRNDGEAPEGVRGQFGLGATEWRDISAALDYAVDHGATEVVLVGWSMGGAVVLQTLLRARHRAVIVAVMLDSPVIDWYETLRVLGSQSRVPSMLQRWTFSLFRTGWFRLHDRIAIDLDELNIVAHAGRLTVPILLLHSVDDGFVTSVPSRKLALARPDIVTFVPFRVARHTKLWNYDCARWGAEVTEWLRALPASGHTGTTPHR